MEKNPDRGSEEVPGRPAISTENKQAQAAESRDRQTEEGRADFVTKVRAFVRRLFRQR